MHATTTESTIEPTVSVVLPCKNEAENLGLLLPRLRQIVPDAEILVVDDGSTDASAAISAANSARVISHPYGMGNGAAVKTGARHAKGAVLVFMDADGQHDPADIPGLIDQLERGYVMVVGARSPNSHASRLRRLANRTYNSLASLMTGFVIRDLTSGFRAARATKFRQFLYLLPNGFSYPTTITMAFFRSGFPVGYLPIRATTRRGKSHIRPVQDGFRFFVIILKIGALFSPMRLFLPIAALLLATGLSYYAYTFVTVHRFTNMSALLILASLLTFLIGLISEQVSALHYKGIDEERDRYGAGSDVSG
jgi:glycosyltransferase involved in cell wall biosynthesis